MESRRPGEWGLPSFASEPGAGFLGPYKNAGTAPDVAGLLARQSEYGYNNLSSAQPQQWQQSQRVVHWEEKEVKGCMEELRSTIAGYEADAGPQINGPGLPTTKGAPRWVGETFAVRDELCTPSPGMGIFEGAYYGGAGAYVGGHTLQQTANFGYSDNSFGGSGVPLRSGVSFATPGVMAARQADDLEKPPTTTVADLQKIAQDPSLLASATDEELQTGWKTIHTTPAGKHYMTASEGPPPMVYAQDSWIPWLPQDPQLCHGEDKNTARYVWHPPKELPFPDPNPERVLCKGTDQFVQTRRILKKITWYVPDGLEFQGGVPRVPVKIYGEVPPKPEKPRRQKLEAIADPEEAHAIPVDGHVGHLPVHAAPVDLKGYRNTEEAKDMVKKERAALLQRYQEAAENNMEVGSDCGRALS